MIRRFRHRLMDLEFSWEFKKVSSNLNLVQYFECALSGQGETCRGYAEGWLAQGIQKRSFSEAWERWWLNHISLLGAELPKIPTSSNGFAAHPVLSKAKRNSRLELLERQDVMLSWQKSGVWKKIESDFLLAFIHLLIEKVTRSQDWKIELYFVHSKNSHFTLMGLLIHKSGGILFDSLATDENPGLQSWIKLTLSLLRSIPFVRVEKRDHQVLLTEKGLPRDHQSFYFHPENAKAFDLHRSSDGNGVSLIGDSHRIETFELLNAEGFPALAYSAHPDWPELGWGSSAYHANGWPHPIA